MFNRNSFAPHHSNFEHELQTPISLISCLERIANICKIPINWQAINSVNPQTIQDLVKNAAVFGFELQSVPVSREVFKNTLFPLLIQDHTNAFLVLDHRNRRIDLDKITYAWQLIPLQCVLPTTIRALVRMVISSHPRESIISLISSMVVAFGTLFVTGISGFLFVRLNNTLAHSNEILIISIFICLLGFFCYNILHDIYIKTFNAKFLLYCLPSMFQKILYTPLNALKQFSSNDIVQRLANYESIFSFSITTSLSIILQSISLLMLFIYLSFLNSTLTCVYITAYSILLVLRMSFIPRRSSLVTKQYTQQSKLSSLLSEMFLQIHKIRSSHSESVFFKRWLSGLVQLKMIIQQYTYLDMLIELADLLLPVVLMLFLYGFLYHYSGNATTATVLPFLIGAGQLTTVFDKLLSDITSMLQLSPTLAGAAAIIQQPTENMHTLHHDVTLKKSISFKNINYKNDQGEWLLENVSLEIPRGKFIAIIGKSGAGKSTLLQLLLGLAKPSKGAIYVDDENIAHANLQTICRQSGVVLQSTQLLPGTIFSNIAINSQITLEDAWQAARLVGLVEDIESMPMKMFTYISDNAGDSISGGQKQKILLARALVTQPKILILDEATSALDNTSQEYIFENLKNMDMTRIVVAHRYSTIIHADYIYVLDQGRIVAEGTYQEILTVIAP